MSCVWSSLNAVRIPVTPVSKTVVGFTVGRRRDRLEMRLLVKAASVDAMNSAVPTVSTKSVNEVTVAMSSAPTCAWFAIIGT